MEGERKCGYSGRGRDQRIIRVSENVRVEPSRDKKRRRDKIRVFEGGWGSLCSKMPLYFVFYLKYITVFLPYSNMSLCLVN